MLLSTALILNGTAIAAPVQVVHGFASEAVEDVPCHQVQAIKLVVTDCCPTLECDSFCGDTAPAAMLPVGLVMPSLECMPSIGFMSLGHDAPMIDSLIRPPIS